MSAWYRYPDGVAERSPEAKVFIRIVKRYAFQRFIVGAMAVFLLAFLVLIPVLIFVVLSAQLPAGWPRFLAVLAGGGLSFFCCIFLRHKISLKRYLPSKSPCSFCGDVLHEIEDTSGDLWLSCGNCQAKGLVGSPSSSG